MAAARSTRTARDNARARALGYESYYDFRIHDNGRIPPDVDVPRGQRQRARGHRGQVDFLRELKPGDILVVPDGLGAIEKDARGRFKAVTKMVIREDGSTDTYTFRRVALERMVKLVEAERDTGAVWSPSPSLDQRRLLNKHDRPETE